jgi:capsular polysaccharide biosynthesis protein
MRKWILKPPTLNDLLHLLEAWRVWIICAVAGAALAGLLYVFAPPPYRARATVLVDQNVEQVILEEQNDLRKYAFLQRETDKLKDIAWSDQTLEPVAAQTGYSVAQLRQRVLHLTQPGDGGWHFLADSPNSEMAAATASAWAQEFYNEVKARPEGINPLVEVNFTQAVDLPVTRAVPAGGYIFSGSVIGVTAGAFLLLFMAKKNDDE